MYTREYGHCVGRARTPSDGNYYIDITGRAILSPPSTIGTYIYNNEFLGFSYTYIYIYKLSVQYIIRYTVFDSNVFFFGMYVQYYRKTYICTPRLQCVHVVRPSYDIPHVKRVSPIVLLNVFGRIFDNRRRPNR